MRILVAEDVKMDQFLLEKLLEKLGHEVEVTTDGEEAVKRFQEGTFPMVMLDWMMPNMDGIEACRRIREVSSESEEYCYIVMVTSKKEREDYIEALDAGADDFIVKPIDRMNLAVKIRAGERVLNFNRKIAEKNRDLEALKEELMKHNLALMKQIDKDEDSKRRTK